MAATVLPEDDDLCMTPVAMRLRGLAVLPDLAHSVEIWQIYHLSDFT